MIKFHREKFNVKYYTARGRSEIYRKITVFGISDLVNSLHATGFKTGFSCIVCETTSVGVHFS